MGRPCDVDAGPCARRSAGPLSVDEVRWGIVATGVIARAFARDLATSASGRLVAVASRDASRAHELAGEFADVAGYGSYEELLEAADVDAVYIATPHPMHAAWAIRAAEAGKHVLCEKPLTVNEAEASAVVEAALEHDVFLMEAFMYRCHPQTAELVSLLRAGTIGEVRVIEAVHSFRGSSDPRGRLLAGELGGGGILDVGCYCASGARLVAGVALGRDVAEPVTVAGAAHVGATGVDEWAVASLGFEGGIVAHLSCGVAVHQPPVLRIHGTDGSITIATPWLPTIDGAMATQISIDRRRAPAEVITVTAERGLYAYQADVLATCVARGDRQASHPAPTWDDTLGNMRTLDAWRRAVGVTYPIETMAGQRSPVHGRPLGRSSRLATGTVPGVTRPVSRIVLGTMVAEEPHAFADAMGVFDGFYERGGNAFDTAHKYGEGACDEALGHWLESRGVRSECVVIGKGAHTPNCDPEHLTSELAESLDRLCPDHLDVYLLHRDNVAVPVADFVDVLNEHHRAGRIHAFGGSNWTAARLDEANAYARANGLVEMTTVSNHLSLARMIRPTFEGTITAGEPAFREWLEQRDVALIAWSSQAAGFFTGLTPGGPLAHAWFDDDNLERRRRVEQLAADLHRHPVTVALAWVLHQPINVFPVIGPRRLRELRTSLDALDVDLTPEQVAWLDLR